MGIKLRNWLTFTILLSVVSIVMAQDRTDVLFEDSMLDQPITEDSIFFTSEEVDFIQIQSTISDSVQIAISVYKPQQPSPILLISHGWHMNVRHPRGYTNPHEDFLTIQVDMRGRKYSTGKQDCNGYELYDYYDAYLYALKHYKEYITDSRLVYFSGGSGGGGNGLGLVGKFPDLFCSAVIRAPMSDYALWFDQDSVTGEFRDEMIPWIGAKPAENPEAYRSRSGITTIANVLTPVYIVHGSTDVRVPVSHSRNYAKAGEKLGKQINYLELGNVGTAAHWGNITELQEALKGDFVSRGLMRHNLPILPSKGELTVAGYLVTDHFEVFMNSIDSIGRIEYDLYQKSIKFIKGTGDIKWKI